MPFMEPQERVSASVMRTRALSSQNLLCCSIPINPTCGFIREPTQMRVIVAYGIDV